MRAPIAIVGIGCRFPGANSPDELWRLLIESRDLIREIPSDRWDAAAIFDADPARPGRSTTRWGGFLDDVRRFDWRAFGMSPREAAYTDPQHRLLLEVAADAFDDAAIDADDVRGSVGGVFVGLMTNYFSLAVGQRLEGLDGYAAGGTLFSFAANRLSRYFDLRGPSVGLDTACSSSLTAIHLACNSLWTQESAIAIAGGVGLLLAPNDHITMSKAGALSPTGRCRPLDAAADGFVRSEGAGVLVLLPLSRALEQGCRIYALIRSTATNHNGRNEWLMAPSAAAQETLIRSALRLAAVAPAEVDYVELHGTGTPRGDPVEATALGRALAEGRARPVLVGSIKSNLGHLEAAAGVAGMIKAALALYHQEIPPSLHFAAPNPAIDLEQLRLEVVTRRTPWPREGDRRRIAGVTSIGFGGTNSHAVLEGYDAPKCQQSAAPRQDAPRVLLLSAACANGLSEAASRYARALAPGGTLADADLDDICATAGRRTVRAHRLAVVGSTHAEIAARLSGFAEGRTADGVVANKAAGGVARPLVFVFPGHGAQQAGMGRELLRRHHAFRAALEEIDREAVPLLGWSVADVLAGGSEQSLADVEIVQIAIFAYQAALARLWRAWGIRPDAVIGHSLGEIAAAHDAGALTLSDAIRIIVHRAKLTKWLAGLGGLVALRASVEDATELMHEIGGLGVAAINSPGMVAVGGEEASLKGLMARADHAGIAAVRIPIRYPAHGPQVEAILPEFRAALVGLTSTAAHTAFFSTVCGARMDGGRLDAEYWVRNLRQPVLFAKALEALTASSGEFTFLELAPRAVLARSMRENTGKKTHILCSALLPDERSGLLNAAADLHVHGHRIRPLADEQTVVISLPSYPWQGEDLWPPGAAVSPASNGAAAAGFFDGPQIALASGAHLRQTTLDQIAPSFVRDHLSQGISLVPGSAFLDLVIRSLEESLGDAVWALSDVRLERPLVHQGEPRTIQTWVEPASPDAGRFRILSRGPRASAWLLHVEGCYERLAEVPAVEPLDAIERRGDLAENLSEEAVYDELATAGEHFGPASRAIRFASRSRRYAMLAELSVPAEAQADEAACRVPVSIGLGAMHALSLAAPRARHPRVPVGLRRYWSSGKAGSRCLAAGKWRGEKDEGDVVLYALAPQAGGGAGRPVVGIEGLRLQELPGHAPSVTERVHCYEPAWRPLPELEHVPVLDTEWIVLADRNGVAEALAERLRAHGSRCRIISSGENWSLEGDSPLAGIVHLGAAERDDIDLLDARAVLEAQRGGVLDAAQIARKLASDPARRSARLWLVTCGAQAVRPAELPRVAQAPLWGFGRALGAELSRNFGGLIDLDPSASALSNAKLLCGEIVHAWRDRSNGRRSARQVAFRGGQRLAPTLEPAHLADEAMRLRGDAVYLVTGGFGGLGSLTARWMAERGARHIVLLGRHVPETLPAIEATVHSAAVDVGDRDALAAFLRAFRASEPRPIRGLVHAAGVAPLATIEQFRDADLFDVMRAKVEGSLNLHALLAAEPLEFVAYFSSLASLVESPRLAGYAAANAFLDALAHRERAQGRPAVAVNWGPWAELGMVTRGPAALLAGPLIAPTAGLNALARIIASNRPQVAVSPIEMDLAMEAAEPPPTASSARRESGAVEARIAELLCRVLRVPSETLAFDQPLEDLGLDSLMAAELGNRISAAFGVEVPLMAVLADRTIADIAALVSALRTPVAQMDAPSP
jgi:myxalamid-type polyketide synthase MxaE and MxaD